MPSLKEHQSSETTKLLLIGDSGAGKSGSLASLASAGYNLRIIDTDNGLDVLKSYLADPKSQYDKSALERVHYETLTDPRKAIGGRLYPTKATVWQRAVGLLDHWKGDGYDLGKVSSWGPKDVLVIDSLSGLSEAAYNFNLQLNGKLGGATLTQNEERRMIGATQTLLRGLLELLKDASVKCNVIVTSHITLVNELGAGPLSENADNGGQLTGYPSAIGRALSPHIPRYFNTILLAKTVGTGVSTKHKIFTKSQGIVAAKNTAPLAVANEYPLETGLADYFKALRGPNG